MLLVLFLGLWLPGKKIAWKKSWVGAGAVLFMCSVLRVILTPEVGIAVLAWWIQMLLLIGFGISLWRQDISWKKILGWMIASLMPVAGLGIAQYAAQFVWGSKFLGMATQDPRMLGVSVVEHGVFRVLRVYGSFPHPNIFGAWLVVGIIGCVMLASQLEKKFLLGLLVAVSALFSIALVVTYARSAWLGLLFGFVGCTVVLFRERRLNRVNVQGAVLVMIASVLAFGIVGFSQRAHVLARTTQLSERLELKSVDERQASYVEGWKLFMQHVFFGTGVNGELWFEAKDVTHVVAPLESPHDVPLLALDNFGVFGLLALFVLVWSWRRLCCSPLVLCLLPAFMVDHFLWTFWPGQSLLILVILLGFLSQKNS